jgi:predicted extracellular nuclease
MKLKKQVLLGFLFTLVGFSNSLNAQDSSSVRIAFYNLENLFDYEDDSLKKDEDFLPESLRNWDQYRYADKYNRMAKAILSIGGWQAADVIGVCEVENRKVLEDLIQAEPLKKVGYHLVHFESPDRRGIDVGLLYNKHTVSVLYAKPIPVKHQTDKQFRTRDILYVKMLVLEDTIHYFVNHWPSRYGGQMQSEPKRILAAQTLRTTIDSLQEYKADAQIVIMGDFNDYPQNLSLSEALQAVKNPQSSTELKNLMFDLPANEGTHRYKGEWGYLDQIMVSQAFLDKKGIMLKSGKAVVHKPTFLLEEDEKYPGNKPFRTFLGMRYNKGFSDHLPVYIDLIKPHSPNLELK